MSTIQSPTHVARQCLLTCELRQFRVDAEHIGAGDTVHQLRNAVLIIQGALGLVETRVAQGQDTGVEALLDMAETRLREGRALIVRAHQGRHVRREAGRVAAR